jgi:hypothetical protein
MKKKLMPSEHRITSMEPGEIKHITNDFGEFALIRIPMTGSDDDYLYSYPIVNKAVEAFEEHLNTWSEQIQSAETDKIRDYTNDQQ